MECQPPIHDSYTAIVVPETIQKFDNSYYFLDHWSCNSFCNFISIPLTTLIKLLMLSGLHFDIGDSQPLCFREMANDRGESEIGRQ